MKVFKYQVTWISCFKKPDIFLVNTLEEVEHLKYHGKEEQFLVEVEEGSFNL
tara:strand:+ start:568 stop:723 length:156 start_codon:yes stop_codon:yes gene_type:complete